MNGCIQTIQELRRQIERMKEGWKKGVPTKAGLYLRNNPHMSTVVTQRVYVGNGLMVPNGVLCVHIDGKYVELEKWSGAGVMWWYGPIPDPPQQEE